ncbi:hypothetical protein IU427_12210 [Nocardia beijingensis]|uniref:hypothetical protein n=1 Tax=Nocardia beijingensis TaxID=95162 RepID=UPI0018962A37|nr:hypothetical protein [Nocardia beijingensis]MBF6465937.1 hypothetical protein [Nocardia beijingensis]
MATLLEPGELLLAISGRLTSRFSLVAWARELGDLHAELMPFRLAQAPRRQGFDGEQVRAGIDRLVAAVDAWALRTLPCASGARMHTHSLGEVMSHLAEVYAEAWWTVVHSEDAEIRHRAWFHLGEVREGYAEMVDEVRRRRLRFPSAAGSARSGLR